VYKLVSEISDDLAAVLEPLGVSLRGVGAIQPRRDTLLVTGCGPIGLFAIAIARHEGAARIIAADRIPSRLRIAETMGADVAVNVEQTSLQDVIAAETDRVGVGCIIEASGAPEAVNTCLSCLRKGGRVVLLGNPKEPVTVRNVMVDLMHKELTLRTIHGRKMYETWSQAESLLAEGQLDIAPAITHTFPMSEIDEAFRVILDGRACKVELDPAA
jgi:threonine 3-dehydrogenase